MTNLKNTQIIAIMNQKGGIGKTTTAHALGAGLIETGKTVLYVDLDPQANLTFANGVTPRAVKNSIGTLMAGDCKFKDTVIHLTKDDLSKGDLLPASAGLAAADVILNEVGKEFKLKEALQNKNVKYDYIILDTPRGFGVLTVNALIACTHVVIPTTADAFPLQAIMELFDTFKAVRKSYYNPNMIIMGLLLVKYQKQFVINREVADLLNQTADMLGTKVFNTRIRECIALREAQLKREDIFSYAPKSNAAQDYSDFVKEIIN